MGGKALLELAQETLDIMIPDKVRAEVTRNYVNRDKHIWEQAHVALKSPTLKTRQTDSDSVQFIEDWILHHHKLGLEIPIAQEIHDGEKHCAALAHKNSWDESGVLSITIVEDKKARIAINAFFRRHVVGVAASTPDLILLLLNRVARVTNDQAIKALNEFYNGYTDDPECPLKPGYLDDIAACWRDSRRADQ
jgi:uncharacterized protein (UPF0216 family)